MNFGNRESSAEIEGEALISFNPMLLTAKAHLFVNYKCGQSSTFSS